MCDFNNTLLLKDLMGLSDALSLLLSLLKPHFEIFVLVKD